MRGLAAFLAVAALAALGPTPAANAQSWPTKPIRWIVPFPPGGATDVVARIVGTRLGERLKQPVLVDNRPGASSNIGMEAAARAAPDGYTIFFGVPSLVINPVLYKLSFDPLKDLTPVTQLTTVTFVLLANPDFPPRTVPELLAASKAKPGAVTCGSAGALPQFACELLKAQGQVDISVVPYKGNAPAMNDLIGGQINLLFEVVNVAIPQVKANRARAIATTNPKRGTGPFGNLPTVNETLPGFELVSWQGVLVPTGTPREVIARLNREIAAVLDEDEVRKRLAEVGLDPTFGSPEAFAEIIRRDYAKYAKIIREAGIKPE